MAEKTEGRAVGVRVVLPAFLALVLVFMGAALIMRGFSLLTYPPDLENVYWTDVQDGDVVCAEDISLIEPLLYTDSAMGKTACCLVSYRDAGGDMCVGVLRASASDGLYGFIEEYINDGDASLGGYAVKGYFTARSIDGFGARFGAEYAAACEKYADVLSDYSGRKYNGNVRQTTLCFSYVCGPGENYLAALGRSDTVSGVIGVVIACVGAAGLALSVGMTLSSRRKKREAAAQTGG